MTKLIDLKAGDTVIADGGFTCLDAGRHEVHADCHGRLFIYCRGPANDPIGAREEHFLEGQEDDDGALIGLERDAMPRSA